MNILYRLKMSARPIVDERRFWMDAAIGATAQHISDIVNYFNVKNTNKANMDIANANNENAYKVALMNNQWSEKMLKYNNQFAAEQARLEREWESPEAYAKRLLAAGINPAVALSQGSTAGHVSAPQQGSSGVNPSMPVFQNAHMEPFRMLDGSAAFANLGSAIAQMANAKKSDQETEQAKKMMNDVLREYKAKADMAEDAAKLQAAFGFTIKSKEVAHLANQLLMDGEIINNYKKEGNKIAAQTALTRAEEKAQQALTKIYGEQQREAKQAADFYLTYKRAEVKSMEASVGLSSAQAESVREDTHAKKRENAIIDQYNVTKDGINPLMEWTKARLEKAVHENALMDWQKDRIEQLLPHLAQQAENDAKMGKPWSKEWWFKQIVNVIGPAAASGTKDAVLYLMLK